MKRTITLVLAAAIIIGVIIVTSLHSDRSFRDGSRVKVTVGTARVNAEVAESETAQEKGLSGRSSMGADDGMLFVYDSAQVRSFWMKGMLFPLDILWIAEGKVDEITTLPAPATGTADGDLPRHTSAHQIDAVLEVNAGWASSHGVKVGDPVSVKPAH